MQASQKFERVIRYGLALILTTVGLTACSSDMDELDAYINEVKQREGDGIDPLPEVLPYEAFTYVADVQGLRSPFVPDTPQATGGGVGGTRPDPDRSREYLESFPLDTLGMVNALHR